MNNEYSFSEPQLQAVYQAIFERRDMRHFNGKPVEEALMQRLFAAAHAAPSVGLMQPWRFIRIKNPEIRKQIYDLVEQETQLTALQLAERKAEFLKLKVQGINDCSELVVVSLMPQRQQHIFGRRTLPEMDLASAACAIQNMWLAARAEGIGLGWVSLFEPLHLQDLLAMPASAKPIAILCIGHVDAFYEKSMLIEEHWAQRGDIQDYVMTDVWDKDKQEQAQLQWQV
ncbi:MAG: 5,6-dimethylbenzimidazole synthase [SAR86 cluster bacterium]|uniref:5,6-dimethylbenzimidazole synthase n=1 Tax=SAR86 cluster bacterium TaxID=2030880 RepID=A0A2A4MH20_9GAMM|nr:MAG: 5,6-dimethylbenzimidazole synthase [SAR86 cluster bacterium]